MNYLLTSIVFTNEPNASIEQMIVSPSLTHIGGLKTLLPFNSRKHPVPHVPEPITSPG
jgi:hypothetical protein